jgi:hypothetical protein
VKADAISSSYVHYNKMGRFKVHIAAVDNNPEFGKTYSTIFVNGFRSYGL